MMKLTASVLVLLFSVASGPARGQEPPPTFTEEVEVRVMDIDVVVTGRDGRPVADLKREDFTIRIDGKPVPIDYFARVDEGTIHAPDLANASPDQVLAAYRSGEEAYVPRHFLMYVDVGHLAPNGRKRGLEALRDLVTRMGPNDRARVVLFDRRPKELTEWTSSKEALFAALSRVEKSGVGMSRLLTEQQTLRDIATSGRSMRELLVRNYAQQESAEIRQMLQDVGAEIATLAPLAGKKAFLFVSGGFDFQPGYAMASYALGSVSVLSLDNRNVSQELEAIARRANASEVTFYTVDARGLAAEGMSASNDDPLLSRPGVSFIARQDSQHGLSYLANETGGLALLNSNDLQAGLARVYQDTSAYYSIGVTVSKLPATAYEDVRVDVNRPGATVRARRGYAPRSDEDRARDRVQATLRTNLSYGGIAATLQTAPPVKGKGGRYSLPISVTFPASALTFSPGSGDRRAAADVYIAALDDSGRMSEISKNEATFTLPAGRDETTPLVYSASLTTRKGNHRIVVNVRDKVTGRMGTAKADLRIE